MSRPKKATVDYFPHQCTHQATMFILEQKYGNDGYAFWFKLLEMLGATEGHFIDCNDISKWEFLQARVKLEEEKCIEILDLLVKVGAIDKELWNDRKIWSQKFVDGIAEVYKKRTVETPVKPDKSKQIPQTRGIKGNRNPQSKVEYSKVEESKGLVSFETFWDDYKYKVGKQNAEKSWDKLTEPERQSCLEAVPKYIDSTPELRYRKHPTTYLNGKCWNDEIILDTKSAPEQSAQDRQAEKMGGLKVPSQPQ